jgi:hypothetical protein
MVSAICQIRMVVQRDRSPMPLLTVSGLPMSLLDSSGCVARKGQSVRRWSVHSP